MAADYFRDRANDYRGLHTIFLFSAAKGNFEITGKVSFDSNEKFEKFRKGLDEQHCYFHLGDIAGEMSFDFVGIGFSGLTSFDDDFGTLDDYVNRVTKATSPGQINLQDVLISKALEQQVAGKSKRRKLAS